MSSCSSADFPGMPVCVMIGSPVATWARPRREHFALVLVMSSHDPISPKTPAGKSSAWRTSALRDLLLAHRPISFG
jgi:hypothetical protein